jgi:hypothetical protein
LGVLLNWDIPTSQQVHEQMLHTLSEMKEGTKAHKATQEFYERLLSYRNTATGLGMLTTITLLGIGINFLNIHITRRNMERRATEAKQMEARQPAPHAAPTMGSSSMQRLAYAHTPVPPMMPPKPATTTTFYGLPPNINMPHPFYGNAFTQAFQPNGYPYARPAQY